MEDSVLNVWRPVIYHKHGGRQLAHVIANVRGGGGHNYRVLRTGGDVERAAAPRNRRYRPCASSPTRRLEKFEILRVTRA